MSPGLTIFGATLTLAKSYRRGTHRACSPATTVERFRPLGERIGMTRLANVTGLDVIGLPVWVAIRPNARGLSTSQGKGLTHDAARASALMESIETWHAETIERPVVIESAAALGRRTAIVEIDRLSHYADSLPRADAPIPWIEGYDLIQHRPCWVPFECVSTNYVVSARRAAETTFVQSSNGLAGGNHVLEATAHALAELIERDAIAGHAAALRRLDPALRVDVSTIDDDDCRTVLDRLAQVGITAALFDLTSDLAVPVYACSIVDADATLRWRTLPVFSGYGCHPTPAVAVLRSVTEAVQSRLTYISGSRDDISATEYARGGNAEDLQSFRTRLAASPPSQKFGGRADLATASFDGDIEMMLERLRGAGIGNVVAVDLSRADAGVPVVKLVVPGLAAPAPMIRGRQIASPGRAGSTVMAEAA